MQLQYAMPLAAREARIVMEKNLNTSPITGKILDIISRNLRLEKNKISPAATLYLLGADSLDMSLILMDIENIFNIQISDEDALILGEPICSIVSYVDLRTALSNSLQK